MFRWTVILWHLALLGEKDCLDIWDDTAVWDCDPCQKFVELLIVFHCQQDVARSDALLLVVTAGVSCQLQDFGAEVLQDGCEVHRRAVANSLSVVAFPQQPVDSADRERDPCSGRAGHRRLWFGYSFLPSAGHFQSELRETLQVTQLMKVTQDVKGHLKKKKKVNFKIQGFKHLLFKRKSFRAWSQLAIKSSFYEHIQCIF